MKAFFTNIREIVCDYYPRWVFVFTFIVYLGIVMVSGLQMYLYEHFMKFGGFQKTVAHGGTMIGMGLGALTAAVMTKMFDKKGAVIFGVLWSALANSVLALLFLPGILKPGQTLLLGSTEFPVAFTVFVLFHAAYWFGIGIMVPVATSMMADVSEIHQIKTGINKDGGYSAVFVFAMKYAISIGTLITGLSLSIIGFQKDVVPDQVIVNKLCALCLLGGPVISLLSLIAIYKYPVTKQILDNIRFSGNHLAPQYVKNS
jgi:GPH family glycoside/pentoside/hexuronide:cation symporter